MAVLALSSVLYQSTHHHHPYDEDAKSLAASTAQQQPEPKWINPPPPPSPPLPPSAAAPHTPLRLRQHCIAPAPPPAGEARPLARVGACMHVIGSGRARVERSHAGAGADRRAGRGRDDIYSKLLKLTSSRYL